ncbi:Wzz/FepE/Etk N-terminal domain-containing protein [Photobacterium damselae]|uniref:Wzz/FepE/Etk N-terminal domain-containing protein n=1 Tax=Photobacterium damselae TaxID=38293 RepID=UPI003B66E31E
MNSNSYRDVNVSDGGDLREVLNLIWSGKKEIAITTIILTLVALIYSFYAKQWWSSTAYITETNYQTFSPVRIEVSNLAAVLGDKKDPELEKMLSPSHALNLFINEFDSYDNKVSFIESNNLVKNIFIKDKIEYTQKNIEEWTKYINVKKIDNAKQQYKLSFLANTSKDSYKLLTDYISYIQGISNQEITHTIKSIITNYTVDYNSKIELAKNNVVNKINLEKEKTQYALMIAKAADVRKPISELNSNNQMFPIDIGISGLTEQEKVLGNIKNYAVFDPNLKLMLNALDLLKKIKITNNNLELIKYNKKPSEPVNREAPKRSLIVILGIFLGFVFGSTFVIFRKK